MIWSKLKAKTANSGQLFRPELVEFRQQSARRTEKDNATITEDICL